MLHLVPSDEAPAVTSEHQRRVDDLQAAIRAVGKAAARPSIFKPAPPLPRPSRDLLDHRIAEELACIGRRLEQLGGVLSGDPILLHRHAAQLQSIDLINQMLGHLARVIATEERDKAVALITLTELKARLQRRSLGT